MEIFNIDSCATQSTRLSNQSGIALTRNASYLAENIDQEFVVDGFSFVLIESGCVNLTIGGEDCHFEAGEAIILNRGHRVCNMMVSPNFQFRAVFLSQEFFESLIRRLELNWQLRSGISVFSHLKYLPHPNEFQVLCLYFDLLDSKRQQTRKQQQGIDALCEAFGYEMLDQMEHHGFLSNGTVITDNVTRDAAHQHFDLFMNSLLSADVVNRKVAYYADQLNISAKYLNTICHQVAQQSPSVLIEHELLQRATKLLTQSTLSIKEIAYQLGFSNQSHFGTFLRRVAGKSPQQIRQD